MDYNDFKEFFKVHVKQYGPYKDSKMFQVFSNFLMDSYYNDSYNSIPSSFKSAFETQVIPSEFVNPLLQSLGIPNSDIDKIPNSDKFKIVNSLSDFHRYKGTIKLVDNLVSAFDTSDNIAIYELYLDVQIDANGSKIWNVLPKMIGSGTGFQRSLALTSAELFTLLDQAQNWFIDEVTLSTLYDAGELILPYKTNCILLDSTILNNLEPVTQIVSELVVETFKDSKMQVFFNDGTYVSTFGNVNVLWYYIFQKLYSKGNEIVTAGNTHSISGRSVFARYVIPNADGSLSRGGTNDLNSSLTNIQSMIDEYSKLTISGPTSSTAIDAFYNKYIDIFTISGFSRIQTFSEYRASVTSIVGVELINYIDNRMDTAINKKNESSLIGAEIYSSLLTFKSLNNSNFNMDYLNYYYLNLPGLVKDIKNSTTYVMLNFLKPYHSDLIDRQNQKTICSSKFDNALASYATVFNTIYSDVSSMMVVDNSIFNAATIGSDTVGNGTAASISFASFNTIYTLLKTPDIATASYVILFQTIMNAASSSPISDDVLKLMTSTIEMQSLPVLSALGTMSSIYVGMRNFEILLENNIVKLGTMNTISMIASDSALPSPVVSNYESLPVNDIVTSFVYDNPVTGSHIIYTN